MLDSSSTYPLWERRGTTICLIRSPSMVFRNDFLLTYMACVDDRLLRVSNLLDRVLLSGSLKVVIHPLISASVGLGVAFLPKLCGSCQRAALRPFLNLLSRLGRDCPQSCAPKHHMRPSRIRWVPAFGGSTQEHQLNFHGWLQDPRSTNSFAKTLASPMDA